MTADERKERKARNMLVWRAKARTIGHFGMPDYFKRQELNNIELNILDINMVRRQWGCSRLHVLLAQRDCVVTPSFACLRAPCMV